MLEYLKKMLSEAPDEPSLRRHLALASFLFAWGVCFLGFWLELSNTVVNLTTVIIGMTLGAVTVGRFAEAMDKREK